MAAPLVSFEVAVEGEVTHRFSSDDLPESVIGRPPTVAPGQDKFSFDYTGKHDHGELPMPRGDGTDHMTRLVNAIDAAKVDSEAYFVSKQDAAGAAAAAKRARRHAPAGKDGAAAAAAAQEDKQGGEGDKA